MLKTAVERSVTTLNKKSAPLETANNSTKNSTSPQESNKTAAKTSPVVSANETVKNPDSINKMDRLNTANVIAIRIINHQNNFMFEKPFFVF